MNEVEAHRHYSRLRYYAIQLGVYETEVVYNAAQRWFRTRQVDVKFFLSNTGAWNVTIRTRPDYWWPAGLPDASHVYKTLLRESRGLCGIHD